MSRFQSVETRIQGDDQRHEVRHGARQQQTLIGWRSVKDLTDDLRFPSENATRKWLKRKGIVGVRRGRVILVSAGEIQRALRGF